MALLSLCPKSSQQATQQTPDDFEKLNRGFLPHFWCWVTYQKISDRSRGLNLNLSPWWGCCGSLCCPEFWRNFLLFQIRPWAARPWIPQRCQPTSKASSKTTKSGPTMTHQHLHLMTSEITHTRVAAQQLAPCHRWDQVHLLHKFHFTKNTLFSTTSLDTLSSS